MTAKRIIFALFRRVPMPVMAILVGIIAGYAVWTVLDRIQSRQLTKIFDGELEIRLELRARESLIRFDQYMDSYAFAARLLANHRRLANYLQPLFWFADEHIEPVVYRGFRPYWLPDFFAANALVEPDAVMLTDLAGRIREAYVVEGATLGEALIQEVEALDRQAGAASSVLTRIGDTPYLIVREPIEDASGSAMGQLVVAAAVDHAFLAASQVGIASERASVALVDADEQRILASIDPQTLIPGTVLDDWSDTYLITAQSLPQYEGSDWNVLFTTFVTHASLARASRHVGHFEHRQRAIAATVFIFVFTLVIYLVSVRLNKVLKRMTRFAQRALGVDAPAFRRDGNQLLLLEEFVVDFTQLVLKAREEMSRRHESELKETEALKAAVMEASLDSIVTLERDGTILDFNPTAQRTLGFDASSVVGSEFPMRFIPAEQRARFADLIEEAEASYREPGGGRARTELAALREDGSQFPVEISIVPLRLSRETVFTIYMHDITKRKEAEREILQLARFAGESPNPILRVDPEGLIVYANAASLPLLRAWQSAPGQRVPATWAEAVQATLVAQCNKEHEITLDEQIYSLLLVPILELGYVNIYARDITEVRRAEQSARQHQNELVHVCRLSTMGEVATGMAHELNQPLAAIVNYAKGASRRLESGNGEPEALIGAMGHISTQAQRAGEIIRRLRALVGKQPPIRARHDLNALVEEVCTFVEFETSRLKVTPELALWAEEIPVDVDLVQIEQVLLNLVRNALDALSDNPEGERHLSIETAVENGRALVRIIDNGPGITPAGLDRLFDPFFTTKENGMGMGLPISATILENHGGRIRAESEPGAGATFHAMLPLAEGVDGSTT